MVFKTAQDLINDIFSKLGVIAGDETPSAADSSRALGLINIGVDEWAGRSLLSSAQTRLNFSLTANKYSYTIGSGGDFNTAKPFDIKGAFYVVNSGTSSAINTPMDIYLRDEYDSLPDAGASDGPPLGLFYDPGATQQGTQMGTVYIYPVPDNSTPYVLWMEMEAPFTEFASLMALYTFPAAYQAAFLWNGCLWLADDFGAKPSEIMITQAEKTLGTIERINAKQVKSVTDLGMPRKGWGQANILSGVNQ